MRASASPDSEHIARLTRDAHTLWQLARSQMHVYGKNPLLQAVDGEQLLERYGGRCPYIFDAQFYGEAATAAMRGGAATNVSARAL